MVVGALLLPAWTIVASANTLKDIKVASLPGDKVQLRLEMDAPPATKPLSFTIDNPARLALDFPGTTLGVANKSQNIGSGFAQSVSAVEAGGRTRVVLNLTRMVAYDVGLDGSTVVVTVGEGVVPTATAQQTSGAPVASTAAAATTVPTISDIDFRRGAGGEGMVLIKLSDPSTPVNITEQSGKVVVDFANVVLPNKLDRRLDVIDFATPVKEVDTKRRGNGVRMIISPTGKTLYDHLAYQTDNLFTVELKPLTREEEEKARKERQGYTGERLSLNFQNIEVRAVLQLLADFTGLNIVASDTVTGNVTLRLKNVPWDQALDIILKSKGLDKRQNGNVVMIAPSEEIATREKLELEAQKQLRELAPLRTEFVQINYAKASDIAELLKSEGKNIISERGNVSVDERTNTLLIQETAEKLEEIRKLVATLDIPVRQVLIESRIVIANEDFSRDLGVRFGYSKASTGNSGLDPDQNEFVLGGTIGGNFDYGVGTAFVDDDNNQHYIVNLPAISPAGALELAVGKIGSYLLQLELSALQAEGKGEVISSPRVITANQKEAVIEQGAEIPYEEQTSSGATSVTFKKAVLSLRVTPQITPDNRIIMDLKVNKDIADFTRLVRGVPPINTQNVSTQVLVDNGETVVLGGVYETTNQENVRRVPFFSDIPYLGFMFKNTTTRDQKNELLIFVTPKIIKESLALEQ
jgi:type IV pilus assembly protein PilQ